MGVNAALILVRTGLFAESRFMGRVLDEWVSDAQEFVRYKLPHLLLIAIIAFILMRLLRSITLRMIHVAERHAVDDVRIAQVKTLSGVIRATGFTIIGLIAGFSALAVVDINLGPLLASAGVAGVAIGLAAQTIVKDVINGILIIVEDQFNVGDTVKLAGLSGVVESMTLRKTTVRDADGSLYVIPNSQITTVANLSVGLLSGNRQRQRRLLGQSGRSAEAADKNRLRHSPQRPVQIRNGRGSRKFSAWTPSRAPSSSSPSCSRRWPPSNTARFANSAAACDWHWKNTTCCRETRTTSSTASRKRRSRAYPSQVR